MGLLAGVVSVWGRPEYVAFGRLLDEQSGSYISSIIRVSEELGMTAPCESD